MVKINYKYDGLINEKCKYLNISEKDREFLVEILDNYNFDEDIEVNIIRYSTILREFKKDPRIRKDLIYPPLKEYARGKKISQEELEVPFRNCKICYCTHGSNFNDTIVIIFHELNHFSNPFVLSKFNPDTVSVKTLLEHEVKNALNEYFPNKNVVEQLAHFSDIKKILISEGKNYFRQIFTMITCPINLLSERNKISKFFEWGFINFFRYLGYWKGFHEIKENHEIDKGWNDFKSSYYFNFINLKIFKSLKSAISTFNCNFDEIFREFKNFFQKDLNIQF